MHSSDTVVSRFSKCKDVQVTYKCRDPAYLIAKVSGKMQVSRICESKGLHEQVSSSPLTRNPIACYPFSKGVAKSN